MSKNKDVMKALVKLAMCPGDPTKCSYVGVCPHSHYGSICAEQLRRDYHDVLDDLDGSLDVIMHMPSKKEQHSLEQHVTDILHEIGVPANLIGYRYLRYAIILVVNDASYADMITKALYPTIAKKFDTTPSRVERALRHAIEVAWDRGDADVVNGYFGNTVSGMKGKPTNSEFIALIADNIRLSDSAK